MSKLSQRSRIYFVQALVVVQVLVACGAIGEDKLLHHSGQATLCTRTLANLCTISDTYMMYYCTPSLLILYKLC